MSKTARKIHKRYSIAGVYALPCMPGGTMIILPSIEAHREFHDLTFPLHKGSFDESKLYKVKVIGNIVDKITQDVEIIDAQEYDQSEEALGNKAITSPLADIPPVPFQHMRV